MITVVHRLTPSFTPSFTPSLQPALSVHLVTDSEGVDESVVLREATAVCAKYGITHTTIQVETPNAAMDCHCEVQHAGPMGDACESPRKKRGKKVDDGAGDALIDAADASARV